MAPKRDKDGRLQADPEKFPSGMKGLGCAEQSSVMFMTDHRANRFQAVAAVVAGNGEAAKGKERNGRFRILNGDWFSNQVLWDSGDMKPGDQPKKIDIDIRQTESLLLEFKGKATHGCWAEARVIAGE